MPSIVPYGILGLALFVRAFGIKAIAFGPTLLAGVLTLSLLILPIVVITARRRRPSGPTRAIVDHAAAPAHERDGRWCAIMSFRRPCLES